MIRLEIGDEITVDVRNESSEITLKEIQNISNLSVNSTSFLRTWYDILSVISSSEDFMYMSDDDFLSVIKKVKLGGYSEEYTKEVDIEDIKYILESKDGKPLLNVKAVMLIEEYINTNPTNWLKYAIAILYRKEGEDNKTHFNEDNIKSRANLFEKELTGDICFPLMWYVNEKMNSNFAKLKEIFNEQEQGL